MNKPVCKINPKLLALISGRGQPSNMPQPSTSINDLMSSLQKDSNGGCDAACDDGSFKKLTCSEKTVLDSLEVKNNTNLNTLTTSGLAMINSLNLTNYMNVSINFISLSSDGIDYSKVINIINFPKTILFQASTTGRTLILVIKQSSIMEINAINTTITLNAGYTYMLVFYGNSWITIMRTPSN
jgi:hypothetical protein